MVDASHPFWFDPDVQKELDFWGINPQSTRKKILNNFVVGIVPQMYSLFTSSLV